MSDILFKALVTVAILLTFGSIVAIFFLPSCEDQGGKTEFSHMQTNFIYTNNQMIPITTPIYVCKFDD